MKSSRPTLTRLAASLFLPLSLSAHAGFVTISGEDVSFTYDPSSFAVGPGVAGNNAAFLGNSISAQAGGSSLNGIVSTASTVSFFITLTNPNESFDSITLTEHGSYLLSGPNSSVSMTGSTMTISNGSHANSTSSAISPNSAITQNDGLVHGWVASSTDDLSSGALNGSRTVEVTIYDLLTATASPGSTASISAGFAGTGSNTDDLSVGVSSTPLPNSAAMMASGLLGLLSLAFMRRRNPGQ